MGVRSGLVSTISMAVIATHAALDYEALRLLGSTDAFDDFGWWYGDNFWKRDLRNWMLNWDVRDW